MVLKLLTNQTERVYKSMNKIFYSSNGFIEYKLSLCLTLLRNEGFIIGVELLFTQTQLVIMFANYLGFK